MPKALLAIAGSPFIDLKLARAARRGATRVVLLVGHGGEAIVDHVGDGVGASGSRSTYVHDPPRLLGTGGAIRDALPDLGAAFIVTYGDTLLEVPMDRLERRLLVEPGPGVMTVLENRGPMGDQQRRRDGRSGDGLREAGDTGAPSVPGLRDAGDAGDGVRRDADDGPFDLATVLRRWSSDGSSWRCR